MPSDFGSLWMLAIAGAAIAGWWLAVRPGSTYRGVSSTMSGLILLMAVLVCALALHGQSGPRRALASPPIHVP